MLKSFCKVNLFLIVKPKKKNQKLHKIKSLFYLHDKLYDEIIIKKSNVMSIKYIKNGKEFFLQNCIIKKTLLFLKQKFNIDILYDIKVYKHIPIGSGLGGGSSNSAVVAKYLLNKNNIKIQNFSDFLEIGCDVPFFMSNYQAAIVKGYGQKIRPITIDKPNYKIFLNEDVVTNTSDIYKKFDKIKKKHVFKNVLCQLFFLKIGKYQFLINDLEKPFFLLNSDLLVLKQQLSKNKIVKLSGSGSSFIIWSKKNEK